MNGCEMSQVPIQSFQGRVRNRGKNVIESVEDDYQKVKEIVGMILLQQGGVEGHVDFAHILLHVPCDWSRRHGPDYPVFEIWSGYLPKGMLRV